MNASLFTCFMDQTFCIYYFDTVVTIHHCFYKFLILWEQRFSFVSFLGLAVRQPSWHIYQCLHVCMTIFLAHFSVSKFFDIKMLGCILFWMLSLAFRLFYFVGNVVQENFRAMTIVLRTFSFRIVKSRLILIEFSYFCCSVTFTTCKLL